MVSTVKTATWIQLKYTIKLWFSLQSFGEEDAWMARKPNTSQRPEAVILQLHDILFREAKGFGVIYE